MFEKFFYFATTFVEAGFAVFGLNIMFEQPAYTVRANLGSGLEIRDYAPALAIETEGGSEDASFRRLFDTIAGGTKSGETIAMTTPVQTVPAAQNGTRMRFFLPAKFQANPPVPSDPLVRMVRLPAATVAVLRFDGDPAPAMRTLRDRLAAAHWHPVGEPYVMRYNPPFTIPFLKRNEVAVDVTAERR